MRFKSKYFILLPFCFQIAISCYSQDYLGIANSPFAGVNGIDLNPASIVNNPRKWDITLVGLNFAFGNNYLGLQSRSLEHTGSRFTGNYPAFASENFMRDYITKNATIKAVSVFMGANISLPSFMFIRAKHKDAFAFTARSRTYVNVDGIDPALAHMMLEGANDSMLFNQNLTAEKISLQAMVWNEYGLTYGKTVLENNNVRVNVAGRIKFIQGMYAMYLFIDHINYTFHQQDSLLLISSLVHYGHSTNLEFTPNALTKLFGAKPTLGLDLGGTIELYPLTKVRSKMASESNTTPMQHPYRYKFGFSVQDIGRIKYLKPPNARDFTAQLTTDLAFQSLASSGTAPLGSSDDSLKKQYAMVPNDDKFKMSLPTVMSLQGECYAGGNISINSTLSLAPQFRNRESKIHEVTTVSLTPRWDYKFIGTYFPVSYNTYSHLRAGACLRLGPIIFGTADLLPFLSKRDIKAIDFHFLLKVPHIRFKKKKFTARTRSKYEVSNNRRKEKKRNDKSNMPKKDSSPYEVKQKKKKKSKKHMSPSTSDRIIYFKL